jgi:hypothetical protein
MPNFNSDMPNDRSDDFISRVASNSDFEQQGIKAEKHLVHILRRYDLDP